MTELEKKMAISIHAPIVGCDTSLGQAYLIPYGFQSTHPSWGATCGKETYWTLSDISIHAPIVGCDLDGVRSECEEIDFNPRTHRGVRQGIEKSQGGNGKYFNPRTHRGVRLQK